MVRRTALISAFLLVGLCANSCGKKGPPRPPVPRGPLPPEAVEARQVGSRVEVGFRMPAPRGSKPAQQPERAELVRVEYPPDLEPSPDPSAFRRRGAVASVVDVTSSESGVRVRIEDPTWGELPGGGAGWTLRYGVRVRDRRGRPSPLVVALDLVATEVLAPPRNLKGEPTGDGIRLVWDPPSEAGTFRYNLYRSLPGSPFGERPVHGEPLSAPEYLDISVEIGHAYAYSVRTALPDAPPFRESLSSPVVELVAEDRFPPEPPRGLVAVKEGSGIRLFWDPNQEKDLSGYRVYRRADPSEDWVQVGRDPIPEALFLDTDVEVGDRWAYQVRAVDRATPPNESSPSEAVIVDVSGDAVSSEDPRMPETP